MPKMKIKKGDKVEVLTGKDKGKRGEVLRVYPEKNKVVVEGVAIAKRHVKPNAANQQGGIVEAEAAIDASNVALIDPKTDKPTRVGYLIKEDGTKVRVSKKSGAELYVIRVSRFVETSQSYFKPRYHQIAGFSFWARNAVLCKSCDDMKKYQLA